MGVALPRDAAMGQRLEVRLETIVLRLLLPLLLAINGLNTQIGRLHTADLRLAMPLVVLNAALSLGVVSPELFTMGVTLAVLTTAMAGPMSNSLGYGRVKTPLPSSL